MMAYWIAVFLFGVLAGFVVGVWYGASECKREYEERLRVVRRYLTKERT